MPNHFHLLVETPALSGASGKYTPSVQNLGNYGYKPMLLQQDLNHRVDFSPNKGQGIVETQLSHSWKK
jgi:hypothetical protein